LSQDHTQERQYQIMLEYRRKRGLEMLGLMTSQAWYDDPKRLAFTLSRYKFVAKMLSGVGHVLEVGCADAFGTRIVVQEVKQLTAIDFDPLFVEDTNARMTDRWKFECRTHDMLKEPFPGGSTACMRWTSGTYFLRTRAGSGQHDGVACTARGDDHRHAVAGIPAVRVPAQQGRTCELQDHARSQGDDVAQLP
jgi:hypothetical protein